MEAKNVKAGSLRSIAIETINANLDSPANDVVEKIAAAINKSWSEARAYFTYLVENGYTGAFTGAPLERKTKAKAPVAVEAPTEVEVAQVEVEAPTEVEAPVAVKGKKGKSKKPVELPAAA